MIPKSLDRLLSQQRCLLLQGPMGPFFERLAETLRAHGQQVWKVNFNGGDDRYYRGPNRIAFTGSLAQWPARFRELLSSLQIDAVVLFGQSRPWHEAAIEEARLAGVTVFVLEEGYVRPDFITLEVGGVNAESSLPRDPAFYRRLTPTPPPLPLPTGQRFRDAAGFAMAYALAMWWGRKDYPHYQHHRCLHPVKEGLRWVRGGGRKWWYRWQERHLLSFLAAPAQHKRFFFVPLQVHNDAQISHHSPFHDVAEFIDAVLASFARHAPADTALVIKHHPLDRPYKDYGDQIQKRVAELGLASRVLYVHDLHLPTLLKHARGVVTVNSTTGLQSLYHGTPVITLGECLYAIQGLVHPGPLDSFWADPGPVDPELFLRFRSHLVCETQLNASYYGAAPGLPSITETNRRRASASLTANAAAQAPSWSSPTRPTLK